MSRINHKINFNDYNFEKFESNFGQEEEFSIIQVTDSFSMNYPNLEFFQYNYG